jgi:short-subunit dehydrogenase
MSKLFEGSWALVTGASSGLGLEFSRSLARHGANLVLTARNHVRLEELAHDLTRVNGTTTRAVACDLAVPGGALALVERVKELGVRVDHLINNAGFGSAGQFAELPELRESEMVRVNCEAVVALTRAFVPGMVQRARGGVLNVASIAAQQPVPFMATYGATKAFVLSFSVALASELQGSDVRVMAFCPGPVQTGFQASARIPETDKRLGRLDAHDAVERALGAYEAGRTVYTPGFVNSLQTGAVRLLPRSLVVSAAKMTMKRLGRA